MNKKKFTEIIGRTMHFEYVFFFKKKTLDTIVVLLSRVRKKPTIISNLFAVIPFKHCVFKQINGKIRLYYCILPVTNVEWTIHSIGNSRISSTSTRIRVLLSVCVCVRKLCSLCIIAYSLRCKADFILDFMLNWMHATTFHTRYVHCGVFIIHLLHIDTPSTNFPMLEPGLTNFLSLIYL